MEFPIFEGENPREWVHKSEKYFYLYQVDEHQKVGIAEMYHDGKADTWFQSFKWGKKELSWSELVEEIANFFNLDLPRKV